MDIVTSPHPRGEAGIAQSLELVRKGAVEDRADPYVREFAFKTLHAGGTPQDAYSKAQLLLTGLRERFRYINDPVDLEFIASARLALCLGDEKDLCYHGGDCDCCVRAMVALLLIVGIDAAVVHQEFAETDHVITGFKDDRGGWHRIDGCYFDKVDEMHKPLTEKWIDAMTGHVMCSGTGCPMNMNLPSDAVILKARPLGDYVGVSGASGTTGAVDDPIEQILASWGTWLAAVDSDMVAARDAAVAAHTQLISVRKDLGLPEVDAPAGTPNEANPSVPNPGGLWLPNMQSAYEQIVSIATTAHQYASEAVAGKRKAFWATDEGGAGQIALEQLPGDKVQLAPSNTTGVAATDIESGQPLIGGFVGAGPLLIVGAGIAATAVIYGSVYLITRQLCEAIESKQQSVVQQNLVDRTTALVASGKATAAEATAFVQAIGKAAPVATASQNEAAKPSWSENLIEFGKIVLVGGLAVGGIGLLVWLLNRYAPAKRSSVPLLGA